MLSRDEYREIYKMFDRVSPFPYDCGKRCNSICCRADAFPESHLFLYIFPDFLFFQKLPASAHQLADTIHIEGSLGSIKGRPCGFPLHRPGCGALYISVCCRYC